MAILDSRLEFADAVTVAIAAATANLGSQIDLGTTSLDIGNGQPLYLCITVDTAIVTGGSAGTIQFQLASDDTAAISTTLQAVHWKSPIFVTDDDPTIPAGTILACMALPSINGAVSRSVAGVDVTTGQGAPYKRFIGIQIIVGTTTITAGKVNAWLSLDPIGWRPYADAVN